MDFIINIVPKLSEEDKGDTLRVAMRVPGKWKLPGSQRRERSTIRKQLEKYFCKVTVELLPKPGSGIRFNGKPRLAVAPVATKKSRKPRAPVTATECRSLKSPVAVATLATKRRRRKSPIAARNAVLENTLHVVMSSKDPEIQESENPEQQPTPNIPDIPEEEPKISKKFNWEDSSSDDEPENKEIIAPSPAKAMSYEDSKDSGLGPLTPVKYFSGDSVESGFQSGSASSPVKTMPMLAEEDTSDGFAPDVGSFVEVSTTGELKAMTEPGEIDEEEHQQIEKEVRDFYEQVPWTDVSMEDMEISYEDTEQQQTELTEVEFKGDRGNPEQKVVAEVGGQLDQEVVEEEEDSGDLEQELVAEVSITPEQEVVAQTPEVKKNRPFLKASSSRKERDYQKKDPTFRPHGGKACSHASSEKQDEILLTSVPSEVKNLLPWNGRGATVYDMVGNFNRGPRKSQPPQFFQCGLSVTGKSKRKMPTKRVQKKPAGGPKIKILKKSEGSVVEANKNLTLPNAGSNLSHRPRRYGLRRRTFPHVPGSPKEVHTLIEDTPQDAFMRVLGMKRKDNPFNALEIEHDVFAVKNPGFGKRPTGASVEVSGEHIM